jgi:hypothetical protein
MGTPPHSISRTYFVIGRWGYEAPYRSIVSRVSNNPTAFHGLLGNMLLFSRPRPCLPRSTSDMSGVAHSSGALSRGRNGMASRRTSLQDREQAAPYVCYIEKIQTCASCNTRRDIGLSDRVSKSCSATWQVCESTCQHWSDPPTLQNSGLLHAYIFCIPDLRRMPVECKVHAHRQRHRYLIIKSTRQDHTVGIAIQRDSGSSWSWLKVSFGARLWRKICFLVDRC